MRNRILFLLLFCVGFSSLLSAQSTIQYSAEKRVWLLQAGEQSYAFGVNERGELQSIFWGAKIASLDDLQPAKSLPEFSSNDGSQTRTPQEYAAWGSELYTEPAIKATFEDGNRDLVLHYVSHSIDGDQLEVVLKDIERPLFVHLHYRVYPEHGIIARWAMIENRTGKSVMLENAAAATWSLPHGDGYVAHWMTGHWSGEWQQQSQAMQQGAITIESRRGSTSHQANPWFEIGRNGVTAEESGPAWFGELGWSGSWRIKLETDGFSQTRITGGYNPFDFGYKLAPKESLTTPIFYAGYTSKGRGQASRLLHHFQQAEIVPNGLKAPLRPVTYNSWEATEFRVSEAGQLALAEKAAAIGAQRFVIDDGWFGKRTIDNAGLGDWYVNREKFPRGLKPVIDRVHALGMDFGIWVEPEMVNPDSDLYRKHPEWAMNFPGRPRTEGRNQLLLNLARPDVADYVYSWLDTFLTENDISYLKWDYNRNWSEPGWDAVPVDQQKKLYVAYVNNLYDILSRLRAKHPKLQIESCASGGGRVDLGILRYTDEVLPSDDSDALDVLEMQDGFTRAYSPSLMMAWVTDVPNGLNQRTMPLKWRFMVAMNGALLLGSNLNHMTDDELKQYGNYVKYYKGIAETVQRGDLYRLMSPTEGATTATEHVSLDGKQAVVFAYQQAQRFGTPFPTVRLQGLVPEAKYKLTSIDDKSTAAVLSGDYLMHRGVDVKLVGDYDATAFTLERLQ